MSTYPSHMPHQRRTLISIRHSIAIRPNRDQNIANEKFWYAMVIAGSDSDDKKVPAWWFTSAVYLKALTAKYDVIKNKEA